MAIVQYQNKEDASVAIKKLLMEDNLGDPIKMEIQYYQSKESRLKQINQESSSFNPSFYQSNYFQS
jgi:hypothetical protein